MNTSRSNESEPHFFEKICGPYTRATGLPLRFHRPGRFSLGTDPAVPALCRMMEHNPKACAKCLKTHLALQDPEGLQTRTTLCFAGLTSSAVPVHKQGSLIGYLHTGHASVERAKGGDRPEGSRLPAERPRADHSDAEVGHRILSVSKERYEGAVELVELLAIQVGTLHQPNLGGSPYPAIDRALAMIRSDVTKHWTLPEIARRTGMHPAYFSEKFSQRTGVPFTRYLATLRVDRARELLKYTALPVSEIAFASGFRSLSQFNRTFKARTGTSPTQARN